MKKHFSIPTPTPEQRASDWAINATWSVFGDYLPGMPSWSITAHRDGQVTACDGRGTTLDLGKWWVDADDNLVVQIEHQYPTIGLGDADG